MLNFTVGPVQSYPEILDIGANQVPYFRNQSFSKIMLENEEIMKELAYASKDSRVIFLTASGTGAMEASVINCFTRSDKLLIIDGGSFGHRFTQIADIHEIPYEAINVGMEEDLTKEMLDLYSNKGFTGLLVNMCETSVAKLYDMDMISKFCKENNIFLVVDAVSAFLADPLNMEELGINVMLTGSQKALALPPGVSVVVLDEVAQERINNINSQSMYFDFKDALLNGVRGQTPFTPAVGTLIQMNARLRMLKDNGGAKAENERIATLAADFNKKVSKLPVKILGGTQSNSVTAMELLDGKNAYKLFEILEAEYGIWICPNGGALKEKVFRVGHLGNLTIEDNDRLIDAMKKVIPML